MIDNDDNVNNNVEQTRALEENKTSKEKAYVTRNFVKEIKRIKWPLDSKKQKVFLWTFILIAVLIGFFALISFGADEFVKWIGAK